MRNFEEKEVRELIARDHRQSRQVRIIKSKKARAFTVRIPTRFVSEAEIDPEKDKFEFTVEVPLHPNKRASLIGKLVRGK